MNMFKYKDTQITKFIEAAWELPHDAPIIIFVCVPMCIHDITIIPNMYDVCCLVVFFIRWHALVKIVFKKSIKKYIKRKI